MKTEYIVRITRDGAERKRATDFIADQMQKTYGSSPPAHTAPKELFIALSQGAIVGSLATEYGAKESQLPFERLFAFSRDKLPLPYDPADSIYYSRWTSARPGIGQIIWLEATRYAINQGRSIGIAMIKQFVQEQFLKFGCEWLPIPDASLRSEHIAPSDHNYFFQGPPPYPCMGMLKSQIAQLPDIVRELCDKHGIVVHVEL